MTTYISVKTIYLKCKSVAGHGGMCFYSQHSEGRNRQISAGLRPAWSTLKPTGQPGLEGLYLSSPPSHPTATKGNLISYSSQGSSLHSSPPGTRSTSTTILYHKCLHKLPSNADHIFKINFEGPVRWAQQVMELAMQVWLPEFNLWFPQTGTRRIDTTELSCDLQTCTMT